MALRVHPVSEIGVVREEGLATDPLGFLAGDANLYRYVGNNPTNLTDPSGLQAAKPIPVSNPKEKGYEAMPSVIHDVSSIALLIGLSGCREYKEFSTKDIRTFGFERAFPQQSLYELASNSPVNKGWDLEPISLEITGLRFAKVTAVNVGGVPNTLPGLEAKDLEMGGPTLGPAAREIYQTVSRPKLMPSFVVEKSEKLPVAHFIVEGYYLYAATKGNEFKTFAIHLNYEVRTLIHAPYDKDYSDARSAFLKLYSNQPGNILGTGSYAKEYLGVREDELAQGTKGPAIKNVLSKIKMAPGKTYKEGIQAGIPLEIRTVEQLRAGK